MIHMCVLLWFSFKNAINADMSCLNDSLGLHLIPDFILTCILGTLNWIQSDMYNLCVLSAQLLLYELKLAEICSSKWILKVTNLNTLQNIHRALLNTTKISPSVCRALKSFSTWMVSCLVVVIGHIFMLSTH